FSVPTLPDARLESSIPIVMRTSFIPHFVVTLGSFQRFRVRGITSATLARSRGTGKGERASVCAGSSFLSGMRATKVPLPLGSHGAAAAGVRRSFERIYQQLILLPPALAQVDVLHRVLRLAQREFSPRTAHRGLLHRRSQPLALAEVPLHRRHPRRQQ